MKVIKVNKKGETQSILKLMIDLPIRLFCIKLRYYALISQLSVIL